mgnify:CR=1 FL=1
MTATRQYVPAVISRRHAHMTPDQFASAVRQIGQKFGGSVTSWGRTNTRSVMVGGFAYDPHTWWLGADMVYDGFPEFGEVRSFAKSIGVKAIRELHKTHDHFQPLDFPAGPVHSYEGETRQ